MGGTVAAHLGDRPAAVHAAPAATVVLAGVEKDPAAVLAAAEEMERRPGHVAANQFHLP
jgi:hypothetical protein